MRIIIILVYCFITYGSYCQQTNPISTPSKETGLLFKDDFTRLLIQTSSGDRAYDYVKQISMWDRSGQRYDDAANWVKSKAEEFGLTEVEVEKYSTEGMVWLVKKGELSAVAPYSFKITSYDDLPMSLVGNSTTIDTTAEVVNVGSGLIESDYDGKDVKNKIVLTDQHPNSVAQIAILKKGAIGIISSYSVPPWDAVNRLNGDFPDQVGWADINLPENLKGFGFLVSDRNKRELLSILKRKEKLLVKVSIKTERKKEPIKIVSGLIKGSRFPDEEIIITAHLDHYKPGANDNASGCAVVLEMIRTLNYLISIKEIAAPLRTIRILWLPEFEGTTAWFKRHEKDKKKRVVNLNFDMLGANTVKVNSQFRVDYTPNWNGHFINSLTKSVLNFLNKYNGTRYPTRKDYHIISVNGSRNPIIATAHSYSRGSDHQIFNDFGIAGIGFTTWPDDNYHSSEDSPDKVDPTQLHRAAFVGLVLIINCAYLYSDNIDFLLSEVFTYGQRRLADDEQQAFQLINNSDKNELNVNAYLAKAILREAYSRELKSMESCQLVSEVGIKQLVANFAAMLTERETLMNNSLNTIARDRAAKLVVSHSKLSILEENETKFSSFIPERIKGMELFSFREAKQKITNPSAFKIEELEKEVKEKLDELREQEVDDLRVYDFHNAVASYADGNRNLIEIRNAIYAEYKVLFKLTSLEQLFRIFEAAEAMKIKTRK